MFPSDFYFFGFYTQFFLSNGYFKIWSKKADDILITIVSKIPLDSRGSILKNAVIYVVQGLIQQYTCCWSIKLYYK